MASDDVLPKRFSNKAKPLYWPILKLKNSTRYLSVRLDITKTAQWKEAVAQSVEKFGKIDVGLNIAGIVIANFLTDIQTDEIDLMVDVNLKGLMYGSKIFGDLMLKQGFGQIVNIASLAGVAPIQGLSIYSATKFAVRELRPKNIYVSVVCPDLVDTKMLNDQLDHEAGSLTFSGDRVLSVQEITQVIIRQAIGQKKMEILYPVYRGFMGRIGNLFPTLGFYVSQFLIKKGNKKRIKIGKARH
jgi:3-oxoacyl-[acyl-carrier protein] reductase